MPGKKMTMKGEMKGGMKKKGGRKKMTGKATIKEKK